MYLLATLPYAEADLAWDVLVPGPAALRARQLRGALAAAFSADDSFHQHDPDGNPLYRYPRVQYRWRRGRGVVAGWLDAAEKVLNAPWLDLELRLGEEAVRIAEVSLRTPGGTFGREDRLLRYRFGSPTLLFNQENYAKYAAMAPAAQRSERDRLLVAQILTGLRGLEIDFGARLYAAFVEAKAEPRRFKEQELLALSGTFVTNAVLPAGFAFGHATSHGFGWVEPLGGP
ncbi:MAG: hypothetical protein HY900_37450 [Deltaproteobacteria bacterium]|nr:hypothetical protein [Deltaproteobacteria bacterium]